MYTITEGVEKKTGHWLVFQYNQLYNTIIVNEINEIFI